jgi:hydrogenase maturation factor
MSRSASPRSDANRCITCGDVAVEARVVSLPRPHTALVTLAGREEEVATELVEPVAVGDRLLCHAGIALERLGSDR